MFSLGHKEKRTRMGSRKRRVWEDAVEQGREEGSKWTRKKRLQPRPFLSPPSPDLAHHPTLAGWSRALINWKGAGSRAIPLPHRELEALSG